MCLILTLCAGLVASAFWWFKDRQNLRKSGTLALMYFGAGLMWIVDCVFAFFGGEGFLDLSADDAMLGVLVVIAGLVAYIVMIFFNKPKIPQRA